MQHDDLAVALEDGGRVPCDHARVLQQHFGLVHDGEVAVSTVDADKTTTESTRIEEGRGGGRGGREGGREGSG